jgi:hypothetical protein
MKRRDLIRKRVAVTHLPLPTAFRLLLTAYFRPLAFPKPEVPSD